VPISNNTVKRRPGRPRAENATDIAEKLRAAASRVFADFGFEAASIAQIAKEAGVAPTAVYHHYGTKEALWESVFLKVLKASYEHFEGVLFDRPLLGEALEYFLGNSTHMPADVRDSREFLIRCAADMRAFPELQKYRHHRTNSQLHFFRGLADLGVRTGEVHPERDTEQVTELLRTIILGHLWERYTHPDTANESSNNLLAILPDVLAVLGQPPK
jgi:AcrR family transcriptional regulator